MYLGIEHKNTMTDGELIRELCQIIQKLSNRIDDKDLEIKRLKRGIEMRDKAIMKMKPIYADTDSVKIQGDIRDYLRKF